MAIVPHSGVPRWTLRVLTVLLAITVSVVWSSSAHAADCEAGAGGAPGDFAYNGACGPQYQSPAWGDGDGWKQPSKYSTIELADITGNGQDELLARNDDGLEIWRFDTTIGQWRPAIGADHQPEVLTDFRSPTSSEPPDSAGANPMVYGSLQTARVLGNGSESIVAMFPDGIHTWDYIPPAGTKSIDGGRWVQEPVSGPSSTDPSAYLSMRVIGVQPSVAPATLLLPGGWWYHSGDGTPGTGSWTSLGRQTRAPQTSDPRYYLDNRSAMMPVEGPGNNTQLQPVNIYRTPDGVAWQIFDPRQTICGYYEDDCPTTTEWTGVPSAQFPTPANRPFGDNSTECTDDFDCFDAAPSRYETFGTATELRGPNDPDGYVYGRLSDGLHVYSTTNGQGWETLPVLAALKDSPTSDPPVSEWATIRTGDISGDGRTDVLAVVNGQLEAWELDSTGSGGWVWQQLPAQVPLDLGGPWSSSASYYSTLQVGAVAGSGYPDAVIARGPYGVRTWFYCTGSGSSGSVRQAPGCASLGGRSGWTSWDSQGSASYPQYAGNELAAWNALTQLAHERDLIGPNDTSIRSAWAGDVSPTADQLAKLTSGLVFDAGCTNPVTVNPTTYGTCAPPNGIAEADWKAVVNDTLTEIYDAGQVLDYFQVLDNIRADAYLTNDAALPAIGSELQPLNGAAATSVSISPWGAGSAGIGIAGAVIGVLAPEVGVALSAASYALGIISSGTPALQAPAFYGTYADLQSRYATAVSQSLAAIDTEQTEVLQDWDQTQLVTALTAPGGPWNKVDQAGLAGAMQEGLALWAYKTLLPSLYDRYVITGCRGETEVPGNTDCFFSPWGPVAQINGSFTTLQAPPSGNWDSGASGGGGTPCWWHWFFHYIRCDYTSPPTSNGADGNQLTTQIWGPVSNNCNYTGDPVTAWKFGCNLDVPAAYSIGQAGDAYGWDFTTCTGNPVVSPRTTGRGSAPDFEGNCTAPSGTADPGDDGALQIAAATGAPKGFTVTNATFTAQGLLAPTEQRSKSDAQRTHPNTTTAIHLSLANGKQLTGPGGGSELGTAKGAPPATLALTRRNGKPHLQFSVSRIGVVTPQACQQLPASVSETTPSFTVNSSLRITNGRHVRTIRIPATWRCLRNKTGAITKITTVKPTPPAQRPGLRVSVHAPDHVYPGSTIVYRVRLRNTRSGHGGRTVTSLWNLAATINVSPARGTRRTAETRRVFATRPVVRRVRELRHGRTRTLWVAVYIPAALRRVHAHRVCIDTLTTADAARSAASQTCPVIASGPPRGQG